MKEHSRVFFSYLASVCSELFGFSGFCQLCKGHAECQVAIDALGCNALHGAAAKGWMCPGSSSLAACILGPRYLFGLIDFFCIYNMFAKLKIFEHAPALLVFQQVQVMERPANSSCNILWKLVSMAPSMPCFSCLVHWCSNRRVGMAN